MKFPGDMSAEAFLASHWQDAPLFMPRALNGGLHASSSTAIPSLSPEELAWLATLDDVESRLVFSEQRHGDTHYRVETGPFDEQTLSSLPDCDWTLLVQDVEKHLPDFRRWLGEVSFIPDWRIDDLMISFAAPGGSVGPHKDGYDVFLCQGTGQREWRIGTADDDVAAIHSIQLSLLQPFTDESPLTAQPGDVLYLPPGIPHWGIAKDACMTYSIGMRAPTVAELRCCYAREFPALPNPFPTHDSEAPVFYRDPDLSLSEGMPGEISADAVARCRALMRTGQILSDASLATTLGCVVTELKKWLVPESADIETLLAQRRSADDRVAVHGMARLAWWIDSNELSIFANGHCRRFAPGENAFIQDLCDTRQASVDSINTAECDSPGRWLLDMGVFDIHSDEK